MSQAPPLTVERTAVPSDHHALWQRCAHLGYVLLPLVDQERWRQARRHENLLAWDIDPTAGERLIATFAALATHSVAIDTALTAEELDGLPLKEVADAATGKRDYELLAGLPETFIDNRDEHSVNVFRLHIYKGGQHAHRITRLSTELRHALLVLAEQTPVRLSTCGDVFRRAAEADIPQPPASGPSEAT